jgi:hypothetical protein
MNRANNVQVMIRLNGTEYMHLGLSARAMRACKGARRAYSPSYVLVVEHRMSHAEDGRARLQAQGRRRPRGPGPRGPGRPGVRGAPPASPREPASKTWTWKESSSRVSRFIRVSRVNFIERVQGPKHAQSHP